MPRRYERQEGWQQASFGAVDLAGDELVVYLPLPPRALQPNNSQGTSRGAMYALAKAKATYKEKCEAEVRNAVMGAAWVAPERARLHILFGYARDARVEQTYPERERPYRPTDWDNAVASIKHAQDSLVSGGALRGDTWELLVPGALEMSKAEGPFLRVTVERT